MKTFAKAVIAILIIIIILLMFLNYKNKLVIDSMVGNINQLTKQLTQTTKDYEELQKEVNTLEAQRTQLQRQVEAIKAQREQDRKVLSQEVREKNDIIETSKQEPKKEISTSAKVVGVVTGIAATAWSILKMAPKVVPVMP